MLTARHIAKKSRRYYWRHKFMDEPHLYQKIVDTVRQDILMGVLKPGDRLPPIRQMTGTWECTQGTVLRAYQELARQGLVISRVGQGTRVIGKPPVQEQTPIRRAALFNRIEAYLLEIMTAGYTPDEVEQAVRMALEHWRTYTELPMKNPADVLQFVGSQDPAVALIAAQYHKITAGCTMQLTFTGSLGGLIALAQNKADLAGCHLWDDETNTYNSPFVRRLLPGRKVALLTLAHRRVGLLLPPGNPLGLHTLADLARPGLRYVNRQPGSGTRVWLDVNLKRLGLASDRISGYSDEKMTHSEVALAIAQGTADTGLGVQSAAFSFGLDFVFLTTERYDLVIPEEKWGLPALQALARWLSTAEAKSAIVDLGGYDIDETGRLEWVT
jgi:molybdate-binding protein/DNA-binding transcriptional regulator YhcF (GntR family)